MRIFHKYGIDFLNLVEYRQIHDQNIIKNNVNIRIISCYIYTHKKKSILYSVALQDLGINGCKDQY